MRALLAVSLLLAVHPSIAKAQSVPVPDLAKVRSDEWRVTVTLFRSPGTGLQVARGNFAAFLVHYPTVIRRDGEQRNTNFLRLGVAAYARVDAPTSPYLSVSFAPSLTKGWANSGILEIGARQRLGDRYVGQLGAAVLHAPATNQTRVNPTIGLGVQF